MLANSSDMAEIDLSDIVSVLEEIKTGLDDLKDELSNVTGKLESIDDHVERLESRAGGDSPWDNLFFRPDPGGGHKHSPGRGRLRQHRLIANRDLFLECRSRHRPGSSYRACSACGK